MTMSYAKTTLTLPGVVRRFVTPRTLTREGTRVMTNGSVRVSVFGKTDLGRTREHNEDTFLVADLSTGKASLQPEVRSHTIGPRGSLFMVADGMGGAAAGELASAMAADRIHRHMATVWATEAMATAARFAYRCGRRRPQPACAEPRECNGDDQCEKCFECSGQILPHRPTHWPLDANSLARNNFRSPPTAPAAQLRPPGQPD